MIECKFKRTTSIHTPSNSRLSRHLIHDRSLFRIYSGIPTSLHVCTLTGPLHCAPTGSASDRTNLFDLKPFALALQFKCYFGPGVNTQIHTPEEGCLCVVKVIYTSSNTKIQNANHENTNAKTP